MSLTRREFLMAPAAMAATTLVPGSLLAAVTAQTPALPDLSNWEGIRAHTEAARKPRVGILKKKTYDQYPDDIHPRFQEFEARNVPDRKTRSIAPAGGAR